LPLNVAFCRANNRVHFARGNQGQWRNKKKYVPAGAFVNAYLGLGEKDEAFASLEQAYNEQSNILQFLKVHRCVDPLRSDPRFAEFARCVALS
jgi:hypothetical protein